MTTKRQEMAGSGRRTATGRRWRSERLPRALLAIVALVLSPAIAAAADWQMQSLDDGSFFRAAVVQTAGSDLSFVCGERSPTGLSPAVTGNTKPVLTPRDTLRVLVGSGAIGTPRWSGDIRQDVLLVVGATGYRLPPLRWNTLFGSWETDLAAGDAMFAAIAAAPEFELRSDAGIRVFAAGGLAEAQAGLVAYCQSMFAAIGQGWATAPRPGMRDSARAAAALGCSGPADLAPDAILVGEIDGDGAEDAVLDWGQVTCRIGDPRPFCGASMCSASVFLSSVYPLTGQAEEFLGLGVGLQPLSNGNMAVWVGGSLAACREIGASSCRFLYWWNGRSMAQLN